MNDEELKKAIVRGTEFANFAQRFKMEWSKQVEERTDEILYIPEAILNDLARIAFDIINP